MVLGCEGARGADEQALVSVLGSADGAALGTASDAQPFVSLLGARHGGWLAARLGPSAAAQPASAGAGLGPAGLARAGLAAADVDAVLPELAHEAFALRAPGSSFGVGVRLQGARAVPRRALGGASVYVGGAASGATLVLAAGPRGVEDFVAFESAPAEPAVEYEVELDPLVAGLRLVERTLEFLDASGAPRLRVEPPFVVGADGGVARAELSVSGCAVDDSLAPPWGRTPIDPGASVCRVRVSWDGSALRYPALLDPSWSSTGSMSEQRERFASLRLDDGRVLVAGGVGSATGEPSATAELYDPSTETWAVTGALAAGRSDFTLSASMLAEGSRALAAGGNGAAGALDSVELYDAETGTWTAGPSLPAPSAAHSAVTLEDGSLLIAGGSGEPARLAADGASWVAAASLLADEPGSTLTALVDGGALLVGPNPPSLQRYFPDEDLWLTAGEILLPRSGHTATRLLDGQVLIVGGSSAQSGGTQAVELYDPSTASSRFVGATSEPRASHSATLLDDGRVAVVGGELVSGASGTEIYDPEWGTWTTGPGTLDGRAFHRAERLGDGSVLAMGGEAPDGLVLASAQRLDAVPVATVISEYKLPPRLDGDITTAAVTELWAAVARPATLQEGRRYPLLVFLHGNHGTCGTGENPRSDFDCTYTTSGLCPEGFVVAPSHRGYDYVASELAARGYIVVSVNANRGITCGGGEPGDGGFNLARGKLLLKHLQQLSEWDRGVSEPPESLGVSLLGKLDFTQVGMMGHSRGGEGVRAAYEQYRDADSPWPERIVEPVVFRGLFEIGPVDGQTSRVLNADGTAWTVLLPMCDGDVSDLQGVRPFDRMLELGTELRETPKSTYVAWGTNHNYFNSEWQESDSPGCADHRALFESGPGITGSAEQRQIGLRSMLAFFSANVGAQRNPSLEAHFDPTAPLLSNTRIDRGFTPALRPNRGITLEDFSGPSGQSSRGTPMLAENLVVTHTGVPEHDGVLQAAAIEFGADPELPAGERFLEIPVSAAPAGVDVSAYTHLEFRTGRERGDDLLAPTPLLVQLVNADASLSEALDASAYAIRLDGPVGGPYNTHVVLQTARLPLTDFVGATGDALRGVRFVFPGPDGATVYIASLRASLGTGGLSPVQATGAPARPDTRTPSPVASPAGGNGSQVLPGERPPVVRQLNVEGNSVVAMRNTDNQNVEIEVLTEQPFQPLDDQLVLQIGDVRCTRSRHPNGQLQRAIFTLDAPTFAAARDGQTITVRYASNDTRQWQFGPLQKSALEP
jgi:Kelch motif protein